MLLTNWFRMGNRTKLEKASRLEERLQGRSPLKCPITFGVKAHQHSSIAGMAELVDAPDLGSGAARRESSSLSTRTSPNRAAV